jgi:hypothetical protein
MTGKKVIIIREQNPEIAKKYPFKKENDWAPEGVYRKAVLQIYAEKLWAAYVRSLARRPVLTKVLIT